MSSYDPALLYRRATPQQAEFLSRTLQLGLDFIEGQVRDGKVVKYLPEEELRRKLACDLPQTGLSLDEVLHELEENVVRYSIAQGDIRYLAFPDTGNAVAGVAADILSAFLNQNLIAFDRSAPSGTFVEMELIQWLRQLAGYRYVPIDVPELTLADLGGVWTSGGNMSNHVAVLVALHVRFPEIKKNGLRGLKKKPVIVLAKGIEHFSFSSAALSLGLGQDSLVWADSNPDYTTNPNALRAAIEQMDPECEPFMVVSVAGNCRTTGIDDISAIRALCDEFGLWLHVDACHGGNLLFSNRLRHRLRGIELAESVSLDPHKGLFVGYPCSYVLFKEPHTLDFICRYPEKFQSPTCLDIGLIMPFYGSRGFHSLKLWLLIKQLGTEGIGALIERRQELNDRLVKRLAKSGWFVLLNDGDYYRTAFVFLPNRVADLAKRNGLMQQNPDFLAQLVNCYTKRFSDALYESGEVVFDAFSLNDLSDRLGLGQDRKYTAMAMAVGHPDMDKTDEDAIFAAMDRFAAPIADDMERELLLQSNGDVMEAAQFSKGPAGW